MRIGLCPCSRPPCLIITMLTMRRKGKGEMKGKKEGRDKEGGMDARKEGRKEGWRQGRKK